MGMTNGHGKAAIVIGILELIIGIALVVISFVVASYGKLKATDSPWWLGFTYLVPGIVGIIGGVYKNQCCMVTFLVFNIILAVVSGVISTFVVLAVAFWSAAVETYKAHDCIDVREACVCNNGATFNVSSCAYIDTIVAVMVIAAVICVLCSSVSLAGSIVGCMATCCAPTEQPNVVVVQQHPPSGMMVQTTTTAGGYPPQWFGSQQPAGYSPFPPAYEPTGDKVNLVV